MIYRVLLFQRYAMALLMAVHEQKEESSYETVRWSQKVADVVLRLMYVPTVIMGTMPVGRIAEVRDDF